jgi:dTDP-4-amino-4,6-dideoxygalactose transaminase
VNVRVPLLDLQPGLQALRGEIDVAMRRVLDSGIFIGGPEVSAFERELAGYLGVAECVSLNSGTDALVLGLRALGVGPGHEVIVPAFGFFATAEAVSIVGARPVFADIDPRSFNLDPLSTAQRVTRHTRAMIPVHLFGQAAPLGPLLELAAQHGLLLLEDAAQALGGAYGTRKLGSFGHAAALSFFPSKNLGALGDGGMLATNLPEVAEACRQLRQHGSRQRSSAQYVHERIGHNSRLDALQAALLRVKLPGLDRAVSARREAAAYYDQLLASLAVVQVPWRDPRASHAFHQYTVRLPGLVRERARAQLAEHGVETRVYYPTPLHCTPVYREGCAGLRLPHAEAASGTVLSLPMWPEISREAQRAVVQALRVALEAPRPLLEEARVPAGEGPDAQGHDRA